MVKVKALAKLQKGMTYPTATSMAYHETQFKSHTKRCGLTCAELLLVSMNF